MTITKADTQLPALTDPPRSLYRTRRLLLPPRLGRIHKGAPKNPDGTVGKDLDYFRLDPEGDTDLLTAWEDAFPGWKDANNKAHPAGQPRKMEILFYFPDAEQNLSVEWVMFGKGGIYHVCHDQTAEVLAQYDEATKSYVQPTGLCPYRTGQRQRSKSDGGCVRRGNFIFLIPAVGEIGYFEMSLSGTDIDMLLASLQAAQQFLDDCARRTGIREYLNTVPFTLSRYPASISRKTPTGLVPGISWALKLKISPAWAMQMLNHFKSTLVPGFQLPAPTVEEVPALTDSQPSTPATPATPAEDVIEGQITTTQVQENTTHGSA